ncbi:site-2 protease family protein [Halegenticoccus tardaugens]|uniref:site-2 protease family protein n=1 Tax=Halegenticoccus tardaugens TaxID=2071624 RepID=UPI00100C2520|nr:site-2 protease family protein [Halegenticoccus tardaugens]
MNTLFWVLAGVLAYSVVALSLQSRGLLPSSVRVQGPLTTIHTKRGRDFLDWLARPRRFWRAWSNVGVGITVVVMVGSFFLLIQAALTTLQNPQQTSVNQPQNFLVIPGVNDFLPLSVAPEIVLGLLIGLVVHEGGHGLLCRVEDIEIESMGVVLLALLPIGAFVEPDEESQREADRGGRTRMFAAGVTNNFAVTVVAFALLFGPVVGSIAVAPGVAVGGAYDGAPAATAGVEDGDRITAVDGRSVSNEGEFDAALRDAPDRTVSVTVNGGERTVDVRRSVEIVDSVPGNAADLSVSPDEPVRITAVNGTQVTTMSEFRSAVGNDTFARLSTSEGEITIPVGATVANVQPEGPLAEAGAPTNGTLTITRIDGERVTDADELGRVLDGTGPGETVEVEAVTADGRETYDVELGENPQDGSGFLGVTLLPGTGGLSVTDFGIQEYPAGTYLALLGGDPGAGGGDTPLAGAVDSFLGLVYLALVLPLASVFGLPYNFPGFTGEVTNFYVAQGGPVSFLGGGVFLLANVLFWTAWINLQLGLFNCIPGYPLDGGRILRTGTEAVVSRLPVSEPYALVRTITTSIGLTMLAALILIVFGPQLLS